MPLPREESDRLILEFWPQLPGLVSKFPQFSRRIDDPIGVASIGLIDAARTFDPGRCSFSSWAFRKVRSALRAEFRRGLAGNRPPTPAPMVLEPVDPRIDPSSRVDASDQIKRILAGLEGNMAAAMRLSLTGQFTREEVGPQLGLCRGYLAKVLGDLRKCPYRQPIEAPHPSLSPILKPSP